MSTLRPPEGRNLGGLSSWIRRKKNRRGIRREGRRVGERGTEKGSAENETPEGRAAGRRKLRGRRARDPRWREAEN